MLAWQHHSLGHPFLTGEPSMALRRRDLLVFLAAATTAWPLGAAAQQGTRKVGVSMAVAQDDPEATPRSMALRAGLESAGWIEGRNLQLEFRWGTGEGAAARSLASELVQLKPDLIVSNGTPATAE